MRLLTWDSFDEFVLTEALNSPNIPPYAILSHTWGADSDEVSFADLQQARAGGKLGYRKIQFCAEQARRDNIRHFWIDTCCINKSDSAELSEAINSMYRWYREAAKCYVYLSDVSANQNGSVRDTPLNQDSSFQESRWFTRGWTLQELLAPRSVEFYSCDGVCLGTREALAEPISRITALPLAALYGTPPTQFPIAERWRWAQHRQTSRAEDKAYCLFGIFDVFMPPIYGEGNHAFLRLEKAVSERVTGSVQLLATGSSEPDYCGLSLRSAPAQHLGDVHYNTGTLLTQPDVDRPEGRSILGDRRVNKEFLAYDKSRFDLLLESLPFARIDFRVNNVKKALLSTCQWLLHHPYFQAWLKLPTSKEHNGFLWIKGKPGCGKSTLMKAAYEWTMKKNVQNHRRQAVIPYFFNARASASIEKSALGLYRTIVFRLLSTCDFLRPTFMSRLGFKKPEESADDWTIEELQDFLCDSVEASESFELYLFLDALDEAEYENDVRQMISFLVELSDRASAAGSTCQVRVCLSSRHYPHISIGRGRSLIVEDQLEHGADIEKYVSKQLTCTAGPEKDALQTSIVKKSARIFLWVALVVEILNQLDDCGASLSDMQARLETIPAGLDELFRDILRKTDHGVERTVLCFQWLLFSRRPLRPKELYQAIEYSHSTTDLAWFPPSDRLARYILNCSLGLAEVVAVAPGEEPVVQFIHETIREFLVKDYGLTSLNQELATNLVGTSHEVLRIACSRYIRSIFNSVTYQPYYKNADRKITTVNETALCAQRESSFSEYAVMHVFKHAERAQQHHVSQEAFLKQQIQQDGCLLDPYEIWSEAIELTDDWIDPETTLLCFLVKKGHFDLVSLLLTFSNTINKAPVDQETALHIAAKAGHDKLVQHLLAAGADANKSGGFYGNPLQAASVHGYESIVHTLLEAGADVDARGGYYNTALQAASAYGHEAIVMALLRAGAEVNAHGGHYGNALQAASMTNHEEIVLILLLAGAEVNVFRLPRVNPHLARTAWGRSNGAQMTNDTGGGTSIRRNSV